MAISLDRNTSEKLKATVVTSADPSASSPYFAVTALTSTDPSANWVAGAWDGSYDASTQRIDALTPTIGTTGSAIEIAAPGSYQLWMRWTIDSETPARRVDVLDIS